MFVQNKKCLDFMGLKKVNYKREDILHQYPDQGGILQVSWTCHVALDITSPQGLACKNSSKQSHSCSSPSSREKWICVCLQG